MANCLNVLWRRSAFGPCADPRSSAQLAATISDSPYVAAGRREKTMAKGQLKGNKEAKKPKADKSQPKVSTCPGAAAKVGAGTMLGMENVA
jgi:hypothetical protein